MTGGAGFIGSNFVLDWVAASAEGVINLDKLTYAGNRENLRSIEGNSRHPYRRRAHPALRHRACPAPTR